MSLHDTLPSPSDRASLPLQRRLWPAVSSRTTGSGWRYFGLFVASFAIAALSLLVLPNSIAYDPWSWLVWGREIAHLALNTSGAASSVKPLPMMMTAIYSVTGPLAPWLWLVTARAGAVMGLLLAYRLGARIAGPVAGVVALIALLSSVQFASYLVLQGMAEPMGAAFALAAVESHLDGRRRATVVWLTGVCLIRIEAWPFACGYALWCIWAARARTPTASVATDQQTRPARLPTWLQGISWRAVIGLAVLAVAIPAVWFLPDLWGSGNLLRSAQSATHESQGGPLLSRVPGLATIREAAGVMPIPFVVAFVLRWVADLVALVRGHRTRTWWLGSLAVCWLVIEAAMAQLGLATGAPRYLLPGGTVLAALVAGCLFGQVVHWAMARWGRFRLTAPALGMVCVLIVAAVAIHDGAGLIPEHFRDAERSGRATHEIGPLVNRNGTRAALRSCGGTVATGPFQVPLLAWTLDRPVGTVADRAGSHGTVFALNGRPKIPAAYRRAYHVVASIGPKGARWVELTTCSGSRR